VSLFDWSILGSWDTVLTPNRPADIDLAVVKTAGAITERRSACVLGSTPEYRAALSEIFDQVVVIDRSREFKALADAIVGQHPGESFLHADWLVALPTMGKRFDLIVSHFTHGNVRHTSRSTFFAAIARALKPSGLFVDTIFHPRSLVSLNEIEAAFSRRALNLQTLNDFNASAVFRAEIIEKLGCIDTSAIYRWLRDGLADNPTFARLIDLTEARVTPAGLRWDYAPHADPASFGYDDFFEVLATVGADPHSAFGPCVSTAVSRRRV
jgi:SAM-dependent methyltransferase